MSRIDDAVKCILAAEDHYRGHNYDIDQSDLRRWLGALNDAGHLMPDLPPANNPHFPHWGVGNLDICCAAPGSVLIQWEDQTDNRLGTMLRGITLTREQVLAVIAASYHEDPPL